MKNTTTTTDAPQKMRVWDADACAAWVRARTGKHAPESDTPESIADILAEMRHMMPPQGSVFSWALHNFADRIEAAAKRECSIREQAAADYALKRGEEIHADRCSACTLRDSAERPGNAAAMREALTWCADLGEQIESKTGEADVMDDAGDIADTARAALSAPARNCDRFKTAKEAEAGFDAFCAEVREGKCNPRDCSLPKSSGATSCLVAWLLAPAEGGKE